MALDEGTKGGSSQPGRGCRSRARKQLPRPGRGNTRGRAALCHRPSDKHRRRSGIPRAGPARNLRSWEPCTTLALIEARYSPRNRTREEGSSRLFLISVTYFFFLYRNQYAYVGKEKKKKPSLCPEPCCKPPATVPGPGEQHGTARSEQPRDSSAPAPGSGTGLGRSAQSRQRGREAAHLPSDREMTARAKASRARARRSILATGQAGRLGAAQLVPAAAALCRSPLLPSVYRGAGGGEAGGVASL